MSSNKHRPMSFSADVPVAMHTDCTCTHIAKLPFDSSSNVLSLIQSAPRPFHGPINRIEYMTVSSRPVPVYSVLPVLPR